MSSINASLLDVTAALFAAKWVHWENHWNSAGNPAYGDHLLFQRLYEPIDGEVDGLMEKWRVLESSPPGLQSTLTRSIEWQGRARKLPMIEASRAIEQWLQACIQRSFDTLESEGVLSLGLNDYLAALSNAHDTAVFLLTQRLKLAKKMPSGLPKGPPYDNLFQNPARREMRQFAESGALSNTIPGHSSKAPPTPNDNLMAPGSESLSTLNRLRVR